MGLWGINFNSQGEWFQLQWTPLWERFHITIKKLLPIVVGSVVWGRHWRGKTVRCLCDNAAVVAIIRSGSSKDPLAIQLVRSLFFFTAHFNMALWPEHIAGVTNIAADGLSCDNRETFFAQVPYALATPSRLPQELVDLLLLSRPDWTSPSWSSAFSTSLRKV